jgi:alpha-L-rhamnosidase
MGFNSAKWVRAGSCEAPYIRKTFMARDFTEARINICGLGFFQLYINGDRVSDHVLVPAWTDYEDRGKRRLLYPINDKFTHRIYYLNYDITSYLVEGQNGIGVLLSNGWYNQNKRNVEGDLWYNKPKLIFSIILKTKTGEEYVVSDETLKWTQSHVIENNIYFGEKHDLSLKLPDFSLSSFNDGSWEAVSILEDTPSIMELQTCPADKKIRTKTHTLFK